MMAIYQRIQLRNDVREYMLANGRGYSVILFEKISNVIREGQIFTCKMLDEIGVPEYVYRKALKDADIFRRAPDLETGGRPAKRWYMPDRIMFDAYESHLHGQGTCPSDHLPYWAYESIKHYRMAMHGAMVDREGRRVEDEDGASMSRKLQSERLGVSRETVRRYDKLLEVESSEDVRQITILDPGNPYGNQDSEAEFQDALRRDQFGYWLLIDGIRTPVKVVLVNLARVCGQNVILCKQLCNRYKLREDWAEHYSNKITGYYDLMNSVFE
jgi:hypothetical protein